MARRRDYPDEVDEPGIPGSDNRWYPSQGQARRAALREATRRGPGYGIAHDPRPARGSPHYHVANRASGVRVSGHFFYGARPPRRVYRDRPYRELEYEAGMVPLGGGEAELEQLLRQVDRAVGRSLARREPEAMFGWLRRRRPAPPPPPASRPPAPAADVYRTLASPGPPPTRQLARANLRVAVADLRAARQRLAAARKRRASAEQQFAEELRVIGGDFRLIDPAIRGERHAAGEAVAAAQAEVDRAEARLATARQDHAAAMGMPRP